MDKLKVHLTYFKPNSGKYYAHSTYETDKEFMFQIFEEVEQKLKAKELPNLVTGHSNYIVHVDVPKHQNNYPSLIIG